jgi:hypothetical protein
LRPRDHVSLAGEQLTDQGRQFGRHAVSIVARAEGPPRRSSACG